MRVKIHCSGTLLALFAAAVVAAGLVALTGAKSAWAAEPSFTQPQNYPVGSVSPRSTTNADFNNDGKMDLAVANFGNPNQEIPDGVAVLLGNGDGTLQAAQSIEAGDGSFSIISPDLNGDGFADLVVANRFSNDVSVLMGNGDGTFDPKQDFAVGIEPTSVTSAHLNDDGNVDYLDVVVSNIGSNDVSVLMGNGDGTFDPKQDFATRLPCSAQNPCQPPLCFPGFCWEIPNLAAPNQVITADFNGDGKADLAAANVGEQVCIPGFGCTGFVSPGGISVLLGNGDGTFQTVMFFRTNNSYPATFSIASVNFNGDNRADLAVANYVSNTVTVWSSNGDGTFQKAQDNIAVGSNPAYVTSEDFNNDGKKDLAVANFGESSDNVSVLASNENGSFQAAQHFWTGDEGIPDGTPDDGPEWDGPVAVIGAQLNNDSSADLAVVNRLTNTVSVLLNARDTTPPAPPVITSPANNTVDTDGNLTLSGTAEANSTVELFEGSTSLGTTTTDASGNWSKTLPPVGDGTHTYTAKAKDAAGNTSGPSSSLTVEVRIPPEVTNVLPAHQAPNVVLNTSVEATFSEAMDEASVEELGTFTLSRHNPDGSTTPVTGTVSYNSSTRKATLDPSSSLASDTTYTATILGGANGAKDLAGNALAQDHTWTFTTATPPPPPPAPPTVVSYTPTLTTGVPRGTQPTATFSTNMNESTLTPTTVKFQIYNKKKKKWIGVAHGVTYDAATRTATVTHETPLAASKKYRVTVTTNVRSSSGLALDQNANTSGNQSKAWTFTTGSS